MSTKRVKQLLALLEKTGEPSIIAELPFEEQYRGKAIFDRKRRERGLRSGRSD